MLILQQIISLSFLIKCVNWVEFIITNLTYYIKCTRLPLLGGPLLAYPERGWEATPFQWGWTSWMNVRVVGSSLLQKLGEAEPGIHPSKRPSFHINICIILENFENSLRTENQMLQSCLNNYLEINFLLVTWHFSAFTMQSFFQGVKSRVMGLVHIAGGWAVTPGGGPRRPGEAAQGLSEPTLLRGLFLAPHSPAT